MSAFKRWFQETIVSTSLLLLCFSTSSLISAATWYPQENQKSSVETEGSLTSFLGEPVLEMQQVFKRERFPNVVVAMDGTIIAGWGSSNVRVRRSEDGGKTWGDEIVVAKPGFQGGGMTVDENSDDILLFAEAQHPPAEINIYRSKDHGKTWRKQETKIAKDKNGNLPSMHMNEHGITLRRGKHKGRLLRPSRWYAGKNDSARWPNHYTNAIYSDDGGKSWKTSDPFPENGTGEATVAELSDGTIYYNSRRHWADEGENPRRRWTATSTDGGATWKNLKFCQALPDGPQDTNYGCMGGLVRLPVKDRDILVYSNCDSPRGRTHGTLWVSFDGGKSWPLKRLVFKGSFAYSSLNAGRPKTKSEGLIYVHFEGGPRGGSTVARLNLSWLLKGKKTGDGKLPDWIGQVTPTEDETPLEFKTSIGQFADLSYEALSDNGLTLEQRTHLFGGQTVHYGPLTPEQRAEKKAELAQLLTKIDTPMVNRCESAIHQWLTQQAKVLPAAYRGRDVYNIRAGAVIFFRGYEIFGKQEYLDAGLARAELIRKAQWSKGHWPWGEFGEDQMRIQDGYNDWPFWIMLYAHKLSGDKKYLESAQRCGDLLLSLQRDGGGWPDQWSFSGRGSGHTGERGGISFNDNATNSTFQIMVMMYHLSGDKKYIAKLANLGGFIVKANIGEGDVVGWAEQYHANGKPSRARAYEIELPYPRALTRATGPLLIWLYLMTEDESHIELLKKAYAWHEHVRQQELDPKRLDAWDLMAKSWADAGRPMHYRPGWPDAWLPDGSNWGRVTAYKMIPWNPVTDEMKKKYGGLIHRSETDQGFPGNCGYLQKWGDDIRAGGKHPECSMGFSHAARGNSLSEVRRALLEHKRGGHQRLLRYYTHPTKYDSDQYLQARIDAAKRALNPRNVKLASNPQGKGILATTDMNTLLAQKGRWYGGPVPRITKWGSAFATTGQWGSVAWYQWQLVYDVKLASGKISADAAARGGRGLETMASQTHLDSWDVLGEWGMSAFEKENFFDVPFPK